jgi:hypothetical protein
VKFTEEDQEDEKHVKLERKIGKIGKGPQKISANDCLRIQKSLAKEFIADKLEKLNSLS